LNVLAISSGTVENDAVYTDFHHAIGLDGDPAEFRAVRKGHGVTYTCREHAEKMMSDVLVILVSASAAAAVARDQFAHGKG
jgi:hypothetical protein